MTMCPLFRSHVRAWKLRLPWGWNTGELGPAEISSYGDMLVAPVVFGPVKQHTAERVDYGKAEWMRLRIAWNDGDRRLALLAADWMYITDQGARMFTAQNRSIDRPFS